MFSCNDRTPGAGDLQGKGINEYCTTHPKRVNNHLCFPLVLLKQHSNKGLSLFFLNMVWFIGLYQYRAKSERVRP